MADPLNITLSLATIDTSHPVFEADQVLTHEQLNGVTKYLDDQDRLTRVELLGVGIVGGLRVALIGGGGGAVTVSKGVGITTDGDLLLLDQDTIFDRFKVYGDAAPKYAPFYNGDTMRKVYELVRKGFDDSLATPLAQLPGNGLKDLVALFFMESYEADQDLCTGTDCDNLGRDCVNTTRVLLIGSADISALSTTSATATTNAKNLPELSAERAIISGSVANATVLNALYRDVCKNIHANIVAGLGTLHVNVPAFTIEVFGADPAPGWTATLNTIRGTFTPNKGGLQYYYDFLKDLVETWNALRDALLDNGGVLLPDLTAFPKHLLLGAVANPSQSRTPFVSSPLLSAGGGGGGTALDHARFLAKKLNVLINTFALPATSPAPETIVTPSRSELCSLEDRAIPYYYSASSQLPILRTWNWQLESRGTSASITGYRAKELGASVAAQSPLDRQIGRYDFFRIEGHLGQDLDTVMDALEAKVISRNLPFAVRAVLLHTDIGRIKRKPTMRYNDLHRLHKLVRSDIDSEFTRMSVFSAEYHGRIKAAAKNGEIPNDSAKLAKADNLNTAIANAATKGRPAFAKKRYSEFRADTSWVVEHDSARSNASEFKREFGDVSRTDVATAFDAAVNSNHKNSLDSIDVLIDDKDKKADERLLFSSFFKSNPGLEHAGGVARGGTFVLVYDDGGKIVADFMLPYRCIEEVEDEPEEPTITHTPTALNKEGFALVKPIPLRFEELKLGIRAEWTKEIDIQTNYMRFFEANIDVLEKFQSTKVVGTDSKKDPVAGIKDGFAKYQAEKVLEAGDRVEKVKSLLQDSETTPAARERLQKELDVAEKEVAQQVVEATQYVAENNLDMTKGGSGDAAMKIIAEGIGKVSNAEARKAIGAGMKTAHDSAPQAVHKQVISQVIKFNNLKI